MYNTNFQKRLTNQNGIATIIALFMMIMLTLIGIAAINISNDEITIAGNEAQEMASFYAAEAGLELASAAIENIYDSTGAPPTTLPSGYEVINNTHFSYNTTDNGAATPGVLRDGTLAGLNAMIKSFTISSVGVSQTDHRMVRLTQEFQAAKIPIYQFAVFYDNDLEISPGPDMNILGRVHTNSNLYIMSGSNLNMDSYVTASGNIIHGPKGPSPVATGNIFLKDTDGNYQNMKNGNGTYLSSADPDWYTEASARWGGRVQDSTFSQRPIYLPVADINDPHKIIERANGGTNPDSYENKADAKIIDGQFQVKIAGVWQDVTALLPAGTITNTVFYDLREGTNVSSTDVDMSLLATSAYFPANGVIYASDQRAGTYNAVRLINGSDIGSALSVFSENPMYVQGDYNSVNKQPAALCSDAITFLSNSWDDAKSAVPDLNQRKASNTTCNAALITGNTNSTPTYFNGGVENLPRLLEKWTSPSRDFIFRGSLINLWNSQQATGLFNTAFFTEPRRDWAYETDFDNPALLPPESPQANIFLRIGWRMEDVALAGPADDYVPEGEVF